jgi:hypothetical protein
VEKTTMFKEATPPPPARDVAAARACRIRHVQICCRTSRRLDPSVSKPATAQSLPSIVEDAQALLLQIGK